MAFTVHRGSNELFFNVRSERILFVNALSLMKLRNLKSNADDKVTHVQTSAHAHTQSAEGPGDPESRLTEVDWLL